MAVSDSDIAGALELFEDLAPLTTRKMMGGLCIYRDGIIFSLLHGDGTLMLKAKGAMIPRLEDMGATRWTYQRDNGKALLVPARCSP